MQEGVGAHWFVHWASTETNSFVGRGSTNAGKTEVRLQCSMSGKINKADLDEALYKHMKSASRKSYTKSLVASPNANHSNWRPRGPMSDSDDESAVVTIRLQRRKSMQNVTLGAISEGKKGSGRSTTSGASMGDIDAQDNANRQQDASDTGRIFSSRGFHGGVDDGGQSAIGPLAADDK